MRLKPVVVTTALLLCLSALLRSQDGVDLGVVDRIKSEAIARSRVMDHLRYLTDVHGPRLTGSAQFEDAAKWTTERLMEYGVSNVHMERFPFGRRWSAEQYSCELLAPHYMRLSAMPLAWSDSTNGPISGEPWPSPSSRCSRPSSSRSPAAPSGWRRTSTPIVGDGPASYADESCCSPRRSRRRRGRRRCSSSRPRPNCRSSRARRNLRRS